MQRIIVSFLYINLHKSKSRTTRTRLRPALEDVIHQIDCVTHIDLAVAINIAGFFRIRRGTTFEDVANEVDLIAYIYLRIAICITRFFRIGCRGAIDFESLGVSRSFCLKDQFVLAILGCRLDHTKALLRSITRPDEP